VRFDPDVPKAVDLAVPLVLSQTGGASLDFLRIATRMIDLYEEDPRL